MSAAPPPEALSRGILQHADARVFGPFIAGLGTAQIISWGSLYYAFPPIAEAMIAELGLPKPLVYGAASVGLMLSGIAAYPVGSAIDRGFGRRLMVGGSLLAALVLLAWSQVAGLAGLFVVMALVGIAQSLTLYEPGFAVVAERLGPDEARRGITALTLWGGFASTLALPVVQLLLDGFGWRSALVALALANLLICGSIHFAVIAPARPRPAAGTPKARPGDGGAVRATLRRPTFWALAFAFTAYALTMSAFTFHLYPLLVERGLDTGSVVLVMALIGPSQVVGRLVIYALAPEASARVLGILTVWVFLASMLLLIVLPPSVITAAVIIVIYGTANGVFTIVRGLAVPDMLSREAYGALNGLLAAPSVVARALAPTAAAMLWAADGSYRLVVPSMLAGALVLAAGFTLAAILSRRGL